MALLPIVPTMARRPGNTTLEQHDSGLHITPLPRIGQELGRFIIERELPRGGQARVYRAWQTDLQRAVALKLLPSSYASDQDALIRFRREIENVARISHPNIVRVFEAGEIEGHPFFTMDFIEGHDAESSAKRGPMDPDEAATIIEAVARAVSEAHKQGIIHRDIKPGNIILRRDGTPILTDFGLAQDLSHSEQLTQTGISMGTPAYMSPEQARGERNRVGVKTDVFALGATLYTLLTGKRPVEGESTYELMLKVAESQGPKWPRAAIEDIPQDLRAIVEMAMANDPAKRYDTADDLADDLERYLSGEWVVARSRGKLARIWLRTRRYVPVAAVILAALGLAGGMVYTGLNPGFISNSEPPVLDDRDLLSSDPDRREDVEPLFGEGGTWSHRGGTVNQGSGGEIVLARTGAEPLLISPKEPACWGDFTLQCELRVRDVSGPLELLFGMPDSHTANDTAYTIALGEGSRDRLELRRLGIPVLSAYRPGTRPLLEAGVWYRAVITRTGQALSFSLSEVALPGNVVTFSFNDIFPAFAGAGRRFAVQGDVAELSLRTVSVSHRDTQHSTEMLLYSVGQFSDAELRVTARLTLPLPPEANPAERNERAALHFLRASCRLQLARPEEAFQDCTAAKSLVSDPGLRSRIFLLASGIETGRGDDTAAIAQLRVAQLSAGLAGELNSWLLQDAANRGAALEADSPERALRYYDFVSNNALGSPGLVCEALYRDAQLRLRLSETQPEAADRLRAEALSSLERIEGGTYLRFGATYAPAMAMLFTLHVDDPAASPGAISEAADWMAAAVDGYGVDNSLLAMPLVRAAWHGRLTSSGIDMEPARRAATWLQAAQRAGADETWVLLLRAMAATERPELYGSSEARIKLWREAAEVLKADEPLHTLPAALAEFFLGSAIDRDDQARRESNLRRALRIGHKDHAGHWFAGAGWEEFANYCVGLYSQNDRLRATELLEKAAAGAGAGDLRLLAARAAAWLPIPR
ncbi:MAG: serine/threonine protein kinase [Planctomycetes bacterium]|nr:serine/threonine protein kinase [Planctomycetota bacterium]